jgi:transposase
MMMSCDDAGTSDGRGARIEVFTGARRRRPWSDEDKARIVAESYAGGGVTISDVARRHGMCPSQLFTWRRQLRRPVSTAEAPLFVPAIVEPEGVPVPLPVMTSTAKSQRRRKSARRGNGAAPIEVSMDGISVRIGRGADATLIRAVLDALKGSQ